MNDESLWHAFNRQVRHRADELAIADRNDSLTWHQLADRVERQIERWRNVGSQNRNAALVHVHHNTIEDVIASLACMAIERVEIAIDGRFSQSMIDDLMKRSLDAKTDWRCALVLWTSGTSGTPRGVMLSKQNLVSNAAAKLAAVPQSVDDHRLTCLSIAHAYARTCDMGTWLLSGCCWTIDLGHSAIHRCHDRPITLINTVPSLANQILHRRISGDQSWSSLRLVGVGGAALDAVTFGAFADCGVEVIQGYGCTETSPVICSASPGKTVAGRVGSLVDGWESQIRDGRLFVRGPGSMIGYLDDAATTALRIDADGWFDTCDLVQQHADGQFEILGRADDVIVLENGFKIHPLSIESLVGSTAVLLKVGDELVLAIQSDSIDCDLTMERIEPSLPPGTRIRIKTLDPPLSESAGELTAKGTIRRHVVARRFG